MLNGLRKDLWLGLLGVEFRYISEFLNFRLTKKGICEIFFTNKRSPQSLWPWIWLESTYPKILGQCRVDWEK